MMRYTPLSIKIKGNLLFFMFELVKFNGFNVKKLYLLLFLEFRNLSITNALFCFNKPLLSMNQTSYMIIVWHRIGLIRFLLVKLWPILLC
jgi:hypothetical protein